MNDLFRHEAVEGFAGDTSAKGSLKSIGIRQRVVVIILIICTGAFALWLFFGSLYETTSADGIVGLSSEQSGVYSSSSGIVRKKFVSVGDYVSVGDPVALIPDSETLSELEGSYQGLSADELQALYDIYGSNSILRAATAGMVTYICSENTYAEAGDMICSITPFNKELDIRKLIAYLPSSKKELVSVGMNAHVMPDYAPPEEYGYINAYISGISEYPENGTYIAERSPEMEGIVSPNETYVRLEISMIYSSQSKNGLSWSSYRGGSLKVNIGTMCHTDIIISKLTPYQWLIGGSRWEE